MNFQMKILIVRLHLNIILHHLSLNLKLLAHHLSLPLLDNARMEQQRHILPRVRATLSKEILRCNRRGIVSLSSSGEKPSISIEELLENMRRGMSYASIGRKLDIDPSEGEVVNVFRAFKEAVSDTPNIEKASITISKHYPTPLWFLWNSETKIIAQECVPSLDGISHTRLFG